MQGHKNDDIDSIITFDKDDADTLDFVAASANLRSNIFGIESKSKFDIKRKFPSSSWILSYCNSTNTCTFVIRDGR
jgi:hypothetical protein